MNCRGYESDLALHVEGDLPASRAPAVEAHVRECGGCRAFLAELRESQRAVQHLAGEPIPDDALAAVRAGIVWAPPLPLRSVRPAVAAGLAAAVVAVALWVERPREVSRQAVRFPGSPVAPTPNPASAKPGVDQTRHPEADESTVRIPTRVSTRVTQSEPTTALCSEDADQLARALVSISRIGQVADALQEPSPTFAQPTQPLVQLATDDPGIVIYWRLESNGGER